MSEIRFEDQVLSIMDRKYIQTRLQNVQLSINLYDAVINMIAEQVQDVIIQHIGMSCFGSVNLLPLYQYDSEASIYITVCGIGEGKEPTVETVQEIYKRIDAVLENVLYVHEEDFAVDAKSYSDTVPFTKKYTLLSGTTECTLPWINVVHKTFPKIVCVYVALQRVKGYKLIRCQSGNEYNVVKEDNEKGLFDEE